MRTQGDNAGLPYELGQLQDAVGREDADATKREHELIEALRENEILIDDDSRGSGWRLVDRDGMNLMPAPAKELFFADKGHCWAYWMGLARPRDARMFAISDPVAEEAAIKGNVPFEMDENGVLIGRQRFAVIEGGRNNNSGEEDESSDCPADPSAEWRLEQGIEEDIEEELAEDAANRLSAAACQVLERWGADALAVLCTTIEDKTGFKLLAYDESNDCVVYGGELINELRGRRS